MTKKRIVVICPGRGSYSRETSNYLVDSDSNLTSLIRSHDKVRLSEGLLGVSELDSGTFRTKTHMSGENASPLIYACSLKDFFSIDQQKYEVVAICGNSMGWYISLALGGSLSYEDGFKLIQKMGTLTHENGEGGQIIYPIVDDDWRKDEKLYESVLKETLKIGAKVSIKLGGYLVIAGLQNQLKYLLENLPKIDKYPFQIPFHSAFHTELLEKIPSLAESKLERAIFSKPKIPLIDGRGNIWSPWSANVNELYSYTLNHQVIKKYDFSSSVSVALKEFCPDHVVLLGPGNSLGGPVAQILINQQWNGLKSKEDFLNTQKNNPYVVSMGISEQKNLVI